MHKKNITTFTIIGVALTLALVVVMLGAYTRLTDAGLGCPDWPGCYGHMTVPSSPNSIDTANPVYTAVPLQQKKAWTEMVHRYIAGTLGLLILIIALKSVIQRKQIETSYALPLSLLCVVVFQAALGMWTVTLKLLPVVVTGHLLGGLSITALLWLLFLNMGGFFNNIKFEKNYQILAGIGLAILIIQLSLGGWVSSNYAALICPDFPYCQGKIIPPMDISAAFHIVQTVGINYQSGILENTTKVSIHMLHRIGALLTFLYIGVLSIRLMICEKQTTLRLLGVCVALILITQVSLGILNIVWLLPLPIAVAHNGVAALLLLAIVTVNYASYKSNKVI